MNRLVRDSLIMFWMVIGTVCIMLTVIGVIHDMSDGKADGMQYINGCEHERK